MTVTSKLTIKLDGHPHASKIHTCLPNATTHSCHNCRARIDAPAAYFYDVDALAWRVWCPACMARLAPVIGGAK